MNEGIHRRNKKHRYSTYCLGVSKLWHSFISGCQHIVVPLVVHYRHTQGDRLHIYLINQSLQYILGISMMRIAPLQDSTRRASTYIYLIRISHLNHLFHFYYTDYPRSRPQAPHAVICSTLLPTPVIQSRQSRLETFEHMQSLIRVGDIIISLLLPIKRFLLRLLMFDIPSPLTRLCFLYTVLSTTLGGFGFESCLESIL